MSWFTRLFKQRTPSTDAPMTVAPTPAETRASASELVSDVFNEWMVAERDGNRNEAIKKQRLYFLLRDALKTMDEDLQ